MDRVERACVIAAAAMEWDWQPEYNNGHTIIPPPAQAIRPAIVALAAAGLLAVREKADAQQADRAERAEADLAEAKRRLEWTTRDMGVDFLDQLVPGDRIWIDGAWQTVANTENDEGDITVWVDRRRLPAFTAPAALLVRRAEQ
jgi:hypothetical protein